MSWGHLWQPRSRNLGWQGTRLCCGWFLFGTPSCRSVLGAAAETEGGVKMCVGDQHPGRELRDAGLGEG